MSGVDFDSIEIRNRKTRESVETARSAASSRANVLIVGRPGTGKTAMARWIHRLGRPSGPLVMIAARDGRERMVDWMARFQESRDGTLLVEDVDLLSMEQQAAFSAALDAVNDGLSPRIICTSRRELRSLARQDLFRQDLYYRLTVIALELPALEQRREDIGTIARFLVDVNAILHGKIGVSLSDEAEHRLVSWSWSGNIRELENVIERAVTLTPGTVIGASQILFEEAEVEAGADLGPGMSLSEVERRLILQTLELTAQNRTRAAQMLGISIRTLRNKLNEYKEAGVV